MNSFRAIYLGLLLAVSFGFPSFAYEDEEWEEEDYGRQGFYVVGGAAVGFENSKDLKDANRILRDAIEDVFGSDTNAGLKLDIEALAGVHVAGGYRLAPHAAVELEFEWVEGDFDLKLTDLDSTTRKFKLGDYSYWLLGVNSKLYALTGRIQPYALVGAAIMEQKISFKDIDELGLSADDVPTEDATGGALRFGGGMDLYLTRYLALRVDYSYLLLLGDLKDNDFMSLNAGLLWRF